VTTVWRLARQGQVEAVRIGRRIRFRPASVEAYELGGGHDAEPADAA
jgi:excisionase family DNA binding protein